MQISIITPTYNSEKTLQETIDSIKKQKDVEYEHLVIDNLSNDSTLEICRKNNIKYISQKDLGIYDAMNKGIKNTEGEIIGIVNSDDVYIEETILKEVIDVFNEKKVDIVYGNIVYTDRFNVHKIKREWKTGPIKNIFVWLGWIMPHTAVFVRRDVYDAMGLFDINYKISADYDFLIRLISSKKYAFYFLDKIIVKMKTGGISDQKLFKRIKEWHICAVIFKKYYKVYPFWFFITRPLLKIKQFLR